MILYTIGHSNHPIDQFTRLLQHNAIADLVDVRSVPYSRFNPQFNKNALQQSMQTQAIEYIYMGAALGGRPPDPSCYRHNAIPSKASDYLNEVNYAEVMKRTWFIEGIKQLLVLADEHSTAILCSEGDPAMCHRQHLIASYLRANHPEVTVLHILKDGNLIDAKSIPLLADSPGAEQLSF